MYVVSRPFPNQAMSTKLFPLPFRSTLPSIFPASSPRPHLKPVLPLIISHKPLHGRLHLSPNPLRANTPTTPAPSPEDHHQLQQARDAVAELLHELGLPQDESARVSLHSPRYLEMLVNEVRELDEHSMWGPWKGENEGLERDLGFKEKVEFLAREKGDNGKVAFLESIGLSLSSAMNVARYLALESLPGLAYKVKCMKEMFFSGDDDGRIIAKNGRRMMMHLSIPVDDDLQQTLSFFQKIEARRGGLYMLGSKDASVHYLVESFPRLLLLSVESHMKPMMAFLESTGIPGGSLKNVLLLFPPIIFCDNEVLRARIRVLEKVGAVDKIVGKMLLKYPWILSTSIQENYNNVLSFFESEKVPKESLHSAIRNWPHLLGCSNSKLKVMVELFDELGVRKKKVGKVIAKSPQLLLQKPQEFLEVVSFLENIGFDKPAVGKLLGRCPEIFASSIESTLMRKIEFLASLGISKIHYPCVIKKYPELLVSDVNRTMLPRLRYLMKIGLSERDIAFMIRRFSPLLGYSIDEVLRPKLEFLINTMDKPVKDVVDYPRYFSYSLEKKIKPRFWVLRGRNIECSLKDMLAKNDEEFAAEFMGVESMLVMPSYAHR